MKGLSIFLITISLAGCDLQKMAEAEREIAAASSGSSTTYDCTYFSEYNTYTDCVTATLANCSSEWQSFPSGGIGACYYPYTGWEACATTSTDWIYTPWNVCRVGVTMTLNLYRSVISCSNAVCACLNTQIISSSCTDGTDCTGLTTPTPIPTCVP